MAQILLALAYAILSLINMTLIAILLKGGKDAKKEFIWLFYALAIVWTLVMWGLIGSLVNGTQYTEVTKGAIVGGAVIGIVAFGMVFAGSQSVGNFVDYNKTTIVGTYLFEVAIAVVVFCVAFATVYGYKPYKGGNFRPLAIR